MNRNTTFRPELQGLEDRCVPSANSSNIIFQNHELILTGANKADRSDVATIQVKGEKVVAKIVELDLDGDKKAKRKLKVHIDEVEKIVFFGRAGNDVFRNANFRSEAYGGPGNDELYGGTARDDFYGDIGNDKLHGLGGDDNLWGGQGNDTLYGGTGKDDLYGELGDDKLYGQEDADVLSGGFGNDLLNGWSGNDKLYGGAGNDGLYGHAGVDELHGDAGSDRLDGGEDGAKDQLYGGTEKDTFVRFYTTGLFGIKSYPEEDILDYEGILGSWDKTEEYLI